MIYFIQEAGLLRNRVKIGFTDNIKDRLAGLRSASPSALNLILTLHGDIETEFVYHELFAKYRLHREWFRYGLRLRLFVWTNRIKPKDISYPPTLPMSDGDAGFIIQGLDIDEDLDVDNQAGHDPNQPTNDEIEAIEAFETIRDSGKFSWNKAVRAAFGEDKTGKHYHDKLKRILDKLEIDYTKNGYDPARATKIRDLSENGMSKTGIAQELGYKSNAGAIFHEIKAALQETKTNEYPET